MKRKRAWLLIFTMLTLAILAFGVADGSWMRHVPAKDHDRKNPYEGQADAVAAGRLVYEDHCSKCHGENAEGTKKRPSLKSARVQQEATEGDLHWLLVNGNMARGMPSWSKLGDPQIWQVISYLKSLSQ
ncbi:MAG: c-type cytochrome [Terriglobales bacterium]